MDAVFFVVEGTLGLAAVGALYRLVRGPTLADRANALDVVLLSIAAGVAAYGARSGDEIFSPLLVVVGLVAFLATAAVARYAEWRVEDP
jgi:multicomponent Na+:H+ antiporter subunit F